LYEKFEPTSGAKKSAGYCGPSSVLLWEELKELFPDEEFSVAVGRVYGGSAEWITGKHVWVVWHQKLKGAIVIDITADQSRKIKNKVIVENIDKLASRGVNYIAYKLADSPEKINESPKRRARLLKSRLC